MSFKGILDYQHSIQFDTEEVRVYYGFESPDVYVLPDRIGLSVTDAGRPDLTITLVKTRHLLSDISFYGTLDFRLSLLYPTENAVNALRTTGSMARVIPATCSGGFLQLAPVRNIEEFPSELHSSVRADWNLVGPTRFLFRLEPGTASLMKESLRNGLLLFRALAILECIGIAPRLPLAVRFNPRELLNALFVSAADSNGRVQSGDVLNFFNREPSLIPVTITGTRDNELPGIFAEAMTDRILSRFGKPAPPVMETASDYFLPDPSLLVGDGIFDWDLRETFEISRIVRLQMNPVETAQQLANQEGSVESSLKEVLIPTLKTGFKCLNVAANIPAYRPNVIKAGVHITADPHVPLRMQAISETVNFNYPDDSSPVILRFSPAEPGNYKYQPFMLLKGIEGVRNIQGSAADTGNDRLLLNSNDFGVDFLTIEAAPDLLEIASLIILSGDNGEMKYEINRAHPLLSVCFPQGDEMPAMQISAVSLETGTSLSLPVQISGSMRVGLHHFIEYGYHTISICCHFNGRQTTLTIELLPEKAGVDDQPSLSFFTPEKNCKDWGYFADSPFACNYRYRFKKNDGSTGEWSNLQSPFVPLLLDYEMI